MTPTLYGVGVGPGDPELLTRRAERVIAQAGTVFVPVADTAASDVGRAEAVLRGAGLLDPDRTTKLVFAMTADPARTAPHWKAAAEAVSGVLPPDSDATAAFVTLGDPNVYSTFTYVARAVATVRPDVTIDTVPGIMAMQELASRSGRPLVIGDETLSLVPALEGLPGLDDALERSDTVVCYKAGRRLPAVRDAIQRAHRLGEAVIGSRLGMQSEGDPVLRGEHLPDEPAEYFSTVIVRRPDQGGGFGGRAGPAELDASHARPAAPRSGQERA